MPNPNANPCHSPGVYPAALKTFWWTIPAPASSSQPDFLQIAQPAPLQATQEISTSNPGSTNGKKLGRRRTVISFLNSREKNSWITTLKFAIEIVRSTTSPSSWKNWNSWDASVASYRYARPGTIIFKGVL